MLWVTIIYEVAILKKSNTVPYPNDYHPNGYHFFLRRSTTRKVTNQNRKLFFSIWFVYDSGICPIDIDWQDLVDFVRVEKVCSDWLSAKGPPASSKRQTIRLKAQGRASTSQHFFVLTIEFWESCQWALYNNENDGSFNDF